MTDIRQAYYNVERKQIPVRIIEQNSPKSVLVVENEEGYGNYGRHYYVRISSLTLEHPRSEREVLKYWVDQTHLAAQEAIRHYNDAVAVLAEHDYKALV